MNAWLFRRDSSSHNRITDFRSKGFIALSWQGIGDLTGRTKGELKTIFSDAPYCLTGRALGSAYATADIFVNQMQPGDLLLVPDGEDIFFARVEGGYYYLDGQTPDDEHRRNVTWLKNTTRSALSIELRSSMKAPIQAADLNRHCEEIQALAQGNVLPAKAAAVREIAIAYPLRRDFTVSFSLPEDITRAEAKRLSQYFETLYFVE